jgi:chorismate mutase
MHSMPVRPVVRFKISATDDLDAVFLGEVHPGRACQGMESIMVPSMSKIRASTGAPAGGIMDGVGRLIRRPASAKPR